MIKILGFKFSLCRVMLDAVMLYTGSQTVYHTIYTSPTVSSQPVHNILYISPTRWIKLATSLHQASLRTD